MPIRILFSTFLLLLFFPITAYAGAAHPTVRLQLKWKHQFQFAGFYAAVHKGFYEQAGLNVQLIEGGPGLVPVEEVLRGKAEFGVANSELLIHRLKGKPVVALAVIFQHSPSVFLALRNSGIMSPDGMIGKRVMLRKGFDSAELLAVFRNEGIDANQFTRLDLSYDINDLIDGKTDVYHAYVSDQTYYLRQKGIPFSVIQPRSYGIDFYGDTLFTTESIVHNQPEIVAAFKQASLQGWEYAMTHIDEMANYIIEKYKTDKSAGHLKFEADSMKALLTYEARSMLNLLHPELIEIGHMNAGRWKHIADTCASLGMIDPHYSLKGFIYEPEPDYGWLKTLLVVIAVICLGAIMITVVLIVFNRRLSNLVALRTQKLQEANLKLIEHKELLEETVQQRTKTLQEKNDQLEQALSEVKTLSGLIPICASCKKIRDDEGYWNQIETYISQHSKADFSHGICPDCAKKLYPDLYKHEEPTS